MIKLEVVIKIRTSIGKLKAMHMKSIKLHFKLLVSLLGLFIYFEKSVAQSPKITFSEINYKSDKSRDSEDWIEIWNYGSTNTDISNWILQGEMFNEFFVIPQGTIIEADQRIVFCRDEVKFAQIFPGVNYLGPFIFRLSGKGQALRLYDNNNLLYKEIFYNDSLPWPETPDGHGRTLELKDPEGDLNNGSNWFSGCMLGSPGKAYTKCVEKLVFSEINSSSAFPLDAGDWVELRNTDDQSIDLSNWTFVNRKDTLEFLIPPNTVIPPGGHLVLARKDKFSAYYKNVQPVVKPFNFAIRGHSEVLRLYDAQGKIFLSMSFHNEDPWPTGAGINGVTMELKDSSESLSSGLNWFAGCKGGSPGGYYTPNCMYTSLSDLIASATYDKISPNPFSERTIIETKIAIFKENENFSLRVFDYTGKEAVSAINLNNTQVEYAENGIVKVPFSRNELPAGIYFYRITNESNVSLSSGKMVIVN